jgi:branched-chain amino acid transport system permease protein
MLVANKIEPRTYLPAVSPESVKMFIFNQTSLTGSLMLFALLTASGLVGAAVFFFLRNNHGLKASARNASDSVWDVMRSERISNLAQNKYSRILFLLIAAAILLILPRTWGGYWNYVFGTVGIYIILGLGLNIITGWAGQLVIGYVAFFAIGAYTFALLTAPEPHQLMWNFWVALGLGVLAAALAGLLIGLPILNLRGDYLAIVTLGFAEIIRILLKSDLMTAYTAGPRGIRDIAGPSLFGKSFLSDVDFMYLIIVAVLVVTFLANRLKNSRTGKAWFAINLDETVARATGVNAFASKLLALSLSAAMAGLAGALFASRNQFTGPDDHALMVSINVICLVIVGGIGNIPGVFLGAFALKGLPEILRETENFRLLIFGVLLIVMMRLRPEGFLPAKRPELEKATIQTSVEKGVSS